MSWLDCSRCGGRGRRSWQRDGKEYDADCYECRGGGGSVAALSALLVLGAAWIAVFAWVCEGAPWPLW